MKSALILILILHQLHYSRASKSNACMNQEYEQDTDENLEKKFASEFSLFTLIKKTISQYLGFNKLTFNEKERLKELCACAMHKRSKKMENYDEPEVKSYEDILKNMIEFRKSSIYVKIAFSWLNFKRWYTFPGAYCQSGEDICTIVRGLKQKSNEGLVYNIYVGIENEYTSFEFQGVIKNVDIEVPAQVSYRT